MNNSYFDNFKELKDRWYKGVIRDKDDECDVIMMVDEMNNTEISLSGLLEKDNNGLLEKDNSGIPEKVIPEKDISSTIQEKAISENNTPEKSNRFDFMSNKGIYRPPSLRKNEQKKEHTNKSSDHTNKSNKYLPSNLSYLLRELSRIMNNQPKASDRISRKIMLEYIWDYLKVNNPSVLLEIESIIPDEMQMLIPKIYMKHLSFVRQES